ncbi:uncharacterized protein LOC131605199 [Vicia villosa]|uniref:uncharacterized protein LOC131605199 n=1 Tax=Vicia villosa TaxID=3911 RepID=UPI00273BADC0|nr:uncharacterized protein LOC131605199 [Vicia villosa]
MASKFCFEALDKSLKDIMDHDKVASKTIFGGKVVVFGGDFRQILPVVPRGTSWDKFKNADEIHRFSKWILQVRDGKISEPNDGYAEICIPPELLLIDFMNPIEKIFTSTYLNILDNYTNSSFLQSRAILASTIKVVDEINDYLINLLPELLSCDSIDMAGTNDNDGVEHLSPEFLSCLKCYGLPNYSLKLKVGTCVIRNLDQCEGFCNGTRLTATRLTNHVIEAKIISGTHIGNTIYITRMSLSLSQSPWPFKLIRRQFPIIVSFAMTINKPQGQSLDYVCLYFPKDVFSQGQLYVAMSRVKSKNGLKILIHDKDKKALSQTTNVFFKEVFHNVA